MSRHRENIRSISINIVSSIIFQIILMILSGSGIIYAINRMVKSLQDNKVTLSILTIIILVVSCIIVTITLFVILRKAFQYKNKPKHILNNIEDYYFSEYEKYLTIYQNGNGIIIHKFKVIANDTKKLSKIRRKLNIEDGKKTSKFPSLDKMMETNKVSRFNEFGFWYKSDNDIISAVKEYYWDSKTTTENKKAKNNPQEIRWEFKINKSNLKTETPYEICYVISVPGLAALEDGKLNKELLNDSSDEYSYSTMNIDHKMQKLRYIISFEDGISIEESPKCKCVIKEQDGTKELDISGTETYDLLYRKYIFDIENPEFDSDINISWKYNII